MQLYYCCIRQKKDNPNYECHSQELVPSNVTEGPAAPFAFKDVSMSP